METNLYACFGGFSDQYWTQLTTPNFKGSCHCLSLCRVNPQTGEMTVVNQVQGLQSPSTLVVSPDKKVVYCTNEEHDFKGRGFGGGVSAVSLDLENEKMELINQTFSGGASACYVSLDRTGKYLLVANHGSKFYCSRFEVVDGAFRPIVLRDEGTVSLFRVREDGGIGEVLDRVILEGTGIDPMEHASAHPHCVIIDEDDFAIIPNKGGDNIYVAKLNRETEKLDVLSVYKSEFGSSPRYAFFVKGTPIVLVQNEYDGHLCSYRLDKMNGTLTRLDRVDIMDTESTQALEFDILGSDKHPWGCDVQVHPNNRFVYTNNTQRIVRQLELDPGTGKLTLKRSYPVPVGFMTRGMQIDPSGNFLVVTGVADEKAFIYRINQESGELTMVSEVALPTPTALRFIEK